MMGRFSRARTRGTIDRRVFVAALAVALGIAGSLVAWRPWRAGPPSRPWNVVLITLDTTRADRLGCYGARHDTPTIDALSRQGVRFEHCYCTVPLTLPSHSSLMTGWVSLRHGVHDNGPERLPPEADTLAEVLSRHGYSTAAVVGAFVLDRRFGLDQGFDHYDDQMPQSADDNKFRYTERNAGQVTDAALAWVEQTHEAPVFLWVHYFDPHSPYEPPGFDPKLAALEPYDAEIAYVDAQLKRLLDGLKQHLGDETLVILTADHGEGLGQHGEITHGLFTYDQTLRVPLIVHFPDARLAGRAVRAPVSLVDVMPSVLAWLKLAGPEGLDGVPLALDDIADQAASPPRALYFENRFPTNMYGWSAVEGIVLGRHKLVRAPRSELYDLEQDPRERTNLFDAGRELSRRLTAKLDEVVAQFAARPALSGPAAAVSEDDLERLRTLGYVGVSKPSNTAQTTPNAGLPDPKDMLPIYNQIQDLTTLFGQGQATRATEMLLNILEASDPANKRALRLAATLSLDEPALRARVIACLQRRALDDERPCIDAFVLGKLGVTLLADHRPAEAAEVFARLVQIEPHSAAACDYLAAAHEQLGDAAEADRWRKRARKLAQPSDQPPDWIPGVLEEQRPTPAH